MEIGISLDERLVSKSLFVISLVFCANPTETELLKLRQTSAAKVFSALDYFIPDLFIQVI